MNNNLKYKFGPPTTGMIVQNSPAGSPQKGNNHLSAIVERQVSAIVAPNEMPSQH